MRVRVLPARELRELDVANVGGLLRELKLHQDACLVIRNDEILTRDTRLSAEDEVEVWPVISGGMA